MTMLICDSCRHLLTLDSSTLSQSNDNKVFPAELCVQCCLFFTTATVVCKHKRVAVSLVVTTVHTVVLLVSVPSIFLVDSARHASLCCWCSSINGQVLHSLHNKHPDHNASLNF